MRRQRAASLQRSISTPIPAAPTPPHLGWLEPPQLPSSANNVTTSGDSSGDDATKMLKNLLFQLIFWPLTLSLMLAGSAYRFLVSFGCSTSPLHFQDPPRWLVRLISKPLRLANPPVSIGAENMERCLRAARSGGQNGEAGNESRGTAATGRPSRAVLFIGNHSLLGLDCVPLLDEVQGRTGVYPRVLCDTLFGLIPGWRQLAEAAGGVKGTLGNCEALMAERRWLLLYPGGAREAFKSGKDDKYQLMWQEKLGFARMAVKHGYTLIPFASVGMEDAISVAFGLDVTWIVRRAEPNRGPLRIPFLYPYNSFQRQYFAFGQPIETAHFGGDWENASKCLQVYSRARAEVERLIQHLQQVQENDPERFLLRRLWRGCRRMLGGLRGESGRNAGLGMAGPLPSGM